MDETELAYMAARIYRDAGKGATKPVLAGLLYEFAQENAPVWALTRREASMLIDAVDAYEDIRGE